MVRVRVRFAAPPAIGSHACSLEALASVTKKIAFLSGVHYLLPVDPVNSVQTLKVLARTCSCCVGGDASHNLHGGRR
jgi:hypothetical protein